MNVAESILLVRTYARDWHIDLPDDAFKCESERKLFRTVAHRIHYESDDWSGFAYVETKSSTPAVFDFRPKRSVLLMPPLWAAYPAYSAATIGWRMGGGEDYRDAWSKWYFQLPVAKQKRYQDTFPVPVDERKWNLWFWDLDVDDC